MGTVPVELGTLTDLEFLNLGEYQLVGSRLAVVDRGRNQENILFFRLIHGFFLLLLL